jgi:PAS domain S-box-containing protein
LISTAREQAAIGASVLTGDRLAELLAAIAETPDFETAAGFFTTQVAEAVGAPRAVLLVVREASDALQVASAYGYGDAGAPVLRIPLDEIGNPAVTCTLALCAGCTAGETARSSGLPFELWTALPVPQPQGRGTLVPLAEDRARELLGAAGARPQPLEARRRLGHAPFGVLLLPSVCRDSEVEVLSVVTSLAGPPLARAAALDDLRLAAERAEEQRGLLNAIVNSLPDPIVITDAVNDILVQNRRAEHLMALRDTDSEGRRRAVEINNLLFTSFLARSVMMGGISSTARELNLVDPDEGTDLLLEVLAHPLSAGVTGEGTYLSVLRDVTDLRRAANELERQVQRVRLAEIEARRERDRLNLILENVADPILVTDDRSNIILMNEQAERLFEPGTAGVESARRARAVRGNDTRFTSFISDFTISPARARREQMQLSRPDTAEHFPVEVVSGKILNERGESLAIVSVLHDLTKQVENERLAEQLQRLNSELEERIRLATADLAEQNARLQWQSREVERANRLKSEFLASMSHELRTPINALIGYTALMLDRIYGEVTPQQEEGLSRIRASAQHLLLLINDILDLAKIEAGKMPLSLASIVITEIVAEITQQIEPLVRKKSLEFRCHLSPDLPAMYTDRTKVKQILLNLLSNAVKFTHTGSVTLSIVQIGPRIRFEVSDTGIGIKDADLETIWEDFRQLDQSRTREYGGTGLGLSITRKLTAALGGQVTARSEYGHGSTFTALLPVHSLSHADETESPVARSTRAS